MAITKSQEITKLHEALYTNTVSFTKRTRQWVRSGVLSYDTNNLAVRIEDNKVIVEPGRLYVDGELFELPDNNNTAEPFSIEIPEELQDCYFRVVVYKIPVQQNYEIGIKLIGGTAERPSDLIQTENEYQISLAICYKEAEVFVVEDERENCDGNLSVSIANNTVCINYGKAYVDGHLFEVEDNNSGPCVLPIPLDMANKMFRVVIRKTINEQREIMIGAFLKAGAVDTLPPLSRMEDCYEISLAHCRIESGSYICVDERDNRAVCGIAEREIEGQHIIDLVYPIGSIYMGTNGLNPGLMFGGTWQSWGNGRVAVGVDHGQTEFNVVEKEGGEKVHKLTTAEMPNHTHNFGMVFSNYNFDGYYPFPPYTRNNTVQPEAYPQTSFTGGDQPHNNLPPYITCYMWKRIG